MCSSDGGGGGRGEGGLLRKSNALAYMGATPWVGQGM